MPSQIMRLFPGFRRGDKHLDPVSSFQPKASADPLNLGYGLAIALTTTIIRVPGHHPTICIMMHMRVQ